MTAGVYGRDLAQARPMYPHNLHALDILKRHDTPSCYQWFFVILYPYQMQYNRAACLLR